VVSPTWPGCSCEASGDAGTAPVPSPELRSDGALDFADAPHQDPCPGGGRVVQHPGATRLAGKSLLHLRYLRLSPRSHVLPQPRL
jgi:hypothetical protein